MTASNATIGRNLVRLFECGAVAGLGEDQLEGRTHDTAAATLGWPVGTVRGRLSRAREMLRKRLMRQGVGITPVALAVVMASGVDARAEIPRAPREATIAITVRGSITRAGALTLAATVGRGLAVATSLKTATVGLAVMTLICASAGIAALAGRDERANRKEAALHKDPAVRAPAADRYGNPLPKGAIARLGTVRFRNHGGGNFGGGRAGTLRAGQEIDHRAGHASRIQGLAVSPADGTVFTVSYGDGPVLHWNPTDGRLLENSGVYPRVINNIAISPDGRTLLFLNEDPNRESVLWDVAARKELRRLAHDGPVWCGHAAFSPDGRMVTGGQRVWDVATGRLIATFNTKENGNWSLPAFGADGRQVISVDSDHVCIWAVPGDPVEPAGVGSVEVAPDYRHPPGLVLDSRKTARARWHGDGRLRNCRGR